MALFVFRSAAAPAWFVTAGSSFFTNGLRLVVVVIVVVIVIAVGTVDVPVFAVTSHQGMITASFRFVGSAARPGEPQ